VLENENEAIGRLLNEWRNQKGLTLQQLEPDVVVQSLVPPLSAAGVRAH